MSRLEQEMMKWKDFLLCFREQCASQVIEDTQMSRLSKNFFVLSFQWLLGSSDILVLVTTNFLSMTTSTKKSTVPAFFLVYL